MRGTHTLPAPPSKDHSAGTVNIPGAVHVYLWAFYTYLSTDRMRGETCLRSHSVNYFIMISSMYEIAGIKKNKKIKTQNL